ncbi:hypothetical protein [Polyangium sp. 6x1]|uniref:hypothetical protein n=1 Tax=Polyangium sp. 6x1 TaxID=3042689 RepID=UPI002482DE3A|nr:hypothetical protein [Polyangium sp. 6x1]MDI1442587.1 hypothetical protein [Polyangium sp. 6x1]
MNARLACWALAGLLMGCTSIGGQTGEIAADPCDMSPHWWPVGTATEHDLNDVTPFGVSGQQAIDATGGSGTFEVAWANGKKSTVSWSLAADTESSPVVVHLDRVKCGDEYLGVSVLSNLASADGILQHEQRGDLYRAEDGAADLRLVLYFQTNPFPDVYAGGNSGDNCEACGSSYELQVELHWEAGASTPRGHADLVQAGTLLGEVGTF